MAFETVKKNLEARGFSVQTFATAAEAADALCAAGIPLEQLIQIVRDAYRTDKPLQRGENDDSSR